MDMSSPITIISVIPTTNSLSDTMMAWFRAWYEGDPFERDFRSVQIRESIRFAVIAPMANPPVEYFYGDWTETTNNEAVVVIYQLKVPPPYDPREWL